MTREIKFRIWREKSKEFITVSKGTMLYDRFSWRELVCGEKLTEWQQYTGIEDKNGKEIYEGDILYGFLSKMCLVKFGHYCGLDYYDRENYGWFLDYGNNDEKPALADDCLHYEIIGNVYETPGLLENSR